MAAPSSFAVIKAVNEIAHAMHSKTVIEAVESPEILAALRDPTLGVGYVKATPSSGPGRSRSCSEPRFQPEAAATFRRCLCGYDR